VRAAGKAILMLVEEVELLHVDLWHARGAVQVEAQPEPEPPSEPEVPEQDEATPVRTLWGSIARLRSRQSPA
jgi:hypothetical protein